MSVPRHQKTDLKRRHFNMIQEYNTSCSSLDDRSFFFKYVPCLQCISFIITITFQADATQCPGQLGSVDELPPIFLNGTEANVDAGNQFFYYLVLSRPAYSRSSQMDGAYTYSH
jgi:hypothetical protein